MSTELRTRPGHGPQDPSARPGAQQVHPTAHCASVTPLDGGTWTKVPPGEQLRGSTADTGLGG